VFKETFLLQKKLNSQVFSGKFVTVNNELVVSQEFLGIGISQTLKSFSHIVIVSLSELFSEDSVVRSELISDIFADFLFEEDFFDVDFVLDISDEALETFDKFFVISDDSQGLGGLLEGDLSGFFQDSGVFEDGHHKINTLFDLFIDKTSFELGDSEEVDGFLEVVAVGVDALDEVLVDHVSDERNEGRHEDGDVQEDVEEDVQGNLLVFEAVITLESVSVKSDVGVGEGIEESEELGDDSVESVGVHFFSDELDQVLARSNDPSIGDIGELFLVKSKTMVESELSGLVTSSFPTSDILEQETVNVVPGVEDLLQGFKDTLFVEAKSIGSDQRTVHQVKSDGVSTVLVDDFHRIRVVLESLGHLLTISSQDETVNDQVLVGILVSDGSGDNVEGIEPTSSLIKTFTDEISGESLFEFFGGGAERIMALSKRHRTRFEPAIKHFIDSSKDALALLRRNSDVINMILVQISNVLNTTELLEFFNRANADHFLEVFRGPDGDGVTPESVSGEAPIFGIFKPVVESLFLSESRDPVGLLVVFQKVVLDGLNLDEPRVDGSVDQRLFGSPAERIRVINLGFVNQQILFLQVLEDTSFSSVVLDVLSDEISDGFSEETAGVNGARRAIGLDDVVLQADLVIVSTESGGGVDNTGTGIISNVLTEQDSESSLFSKTSEVVEEGSVFLSGQSGTLEGFEDLIKIGFLIQISESALGKDI